MLFALVKVAGNTDGIYNFLIISKLLTLYILDICIKSLSIVIIAPYTAAYIVGKTIKKAISIGAVVDFSHIKDINIIDIVGVALSIVIIGDNKFFIALFIPDKIAKIIAKTKEIEKLINDLNSVEKIDCQNSAVIINSKNDLIALKGEGKINSLPVISAAINHIPIKTTIEIIGYKIFLICFFVIINILFLL